MKKTFKVIIFSIIAIVFCYFVYFFCQIIKYRHAPDWQTYRKYMWVFKDTVKNDIDTTFNFSYVKERDIYNVIHYKRDYYITIWEFKDHYGFDVKKQVSTQILTSIISNLVQEKS
jgi:hypothetical protein